MIKFSEDAPFIEFDFSSLSFDPQFFIDVFNGFKDYIIFMKDVVTKKFPALLKKVNAFPAKVQEMQENAKDEIAALDMMKKAQAVAAMAMSVKNLLNVPTIF